MITLGACDKIAMWSPEKNSNQVALSSRFLYAKKRVEFIVFYECSTLSFRTLYTLEIIYVKHDLT